MKVLHLNTFYRQGGAAKAAVGLSGGLRSLGVDSRLLVQFDSGTHAGVIRAATPLGGGPRELRPHLDSLPLRLYPDRKGMSFAPAWLPDSLAPQVARLGPDLIHLHWLAGGFLRLETLARFRRPLVWTLHDSWAFTGGCQIPFDCTRYRDCCGACPLLGSSRECDLSRRVWRRKLESWRDLDLTVVAPSRWLADCARQSSLFRGRRVEVIPNGLEPSDFRPADRSAARQALSLPRDKKLILFGAKFATGDLNKGFPLLAAALQELAGTGWRDRAEVVVFGASGAQPELGLKTHYLGWLEDETRIARLCAAADVFVAPSLQENLPYAVMEASACGTPCVAFDQGGMADLIEHGATGYLARPYEADDLARGISWVLEDDGRRAVLGARARQKVEEEFALDKMAQRYLALYRTVCQPPPLQGVPECRSQHFPSFSRSRRSGGPRSTAPSLPFSA